MYAIGARRSHPAKLARRASIEHHPAVRATLASGSLPASVDLSQYRAGVLDQGQTGSCEAHSGSACAWMAYAAAGQPLPFVPSMRVLYAAARARERANATQAGQPLPPLTDTGLETADLVAVFGEYGVVDRLSTPGLVNGLTPDGRLSDIWSAMDISGVMDAVSPPNVNDEPALQDLLASAQRLVVGQYGVDPTAPTASDVIAASLANKIPVQMAFFVDSAFQQIQPGQVAGAPNLNDPQGGGHAVYLIGYQTQSDGSRVFTLQNSWGQGWCNGGTCLVGPAWLAAAWEAWPYAVAKVS